MARKAAPETIATRVRRLIDGAFNGNVREAAAALRIPQPTLSRIVTGTTTNPRGSALLAIASYFETSVEWLVSGEGEAPKGRRGPLGPYTDWSLFVARLGLSDEGRRAMLDLPTNVESAATGPLTGMWPSAHRGPLKEWKPGEPPVAITPLWQPLYDAMRAEADAWRSFFEALIAEQGIERVRERINARWQDLQEYSKRGQRAAEERSRSRRKS